MAKYREIPCKYYICAGQCQKGREADHAHYCQKCNKYEPRARVRHGIRRWNWKIWRGINYDL